MAKNPSFEVGYLDGANNKVLGLSAVSSWGSPHTHQVNVRQYVQLFKDTLALSSLMHTDELSYEVVSRTITGVMVYEIQIHFGHEQHSRVTYIPHAKKVNIDDYIRGLKEGLMRKAADLRKQMAASPVSA